VKIENILFYSLAHNTVHSDSRGTLIYIVGMYV